MALRRCASVPIAGLVVVQTLGASGSARAQSPAQSLTEEVSITAGASTEDVGAVGTQVRLFGEVKPRVRFYLEGAWGSRSAAVTDAFGSAYPYDKRVKVIEAYAERIVQRNSRVAGIRLGRYRTPFGIYDRGDHAYTGFLRAPLIRYDNYFGLSNNFLEGGVDLMVGTPHVNAEVSLGVPQDVGAAVRRSGLDRVVRVQAYQGSLLVGASLIRAKPYDRRAFVKGDLRFAGVDARWMAHGIQLRGEWITGTPFSGVPGVSTTGWYLDGSVHRRQTGPVTLVARAERLDYPAGRFSAYGRRYTAGARVQITSSLVGQINVMHQPLTLIAAQKRTTVDIGVTYLVRYP